MVCVPPFSKKLFRKTRTWGQVHKDHSCSKRISNLSTKEGTQRSFWFLSESGSNFSMKGTYKSFLFPVIIRHLSATRKYYLTPHCCLSTTWKFYLTLIRHQKVLLTLHHHLSATWKYYLPLIWHQKENEKDLHVPFCREITKEKVSDNTHLIVLPTDWPHRLAYTSKNHQRIGLSIQKHSLNQKLNFINLTLKNSSCSTSLRGWL